VSASQLVLWSVFYKYLLPNSPQEKSKITDDDKVDPEAVLLKEMSSREDGSASIQ
jgi:hypothetical protein